MGKTWRRKTNYWDDDHGSDGGNSKNNKSRRKQFAEKRKSKQRFLEDDYNGETSKDLSSWR